MLNTRALNYINQILTDIPGETDNNTIIVGDFNTLFTSMDRLSRQKINKETVSLKDMVDQLDLIATYRTIHPQTEEYTFFSSAHGTVSRIDHMLGHKMSLSTFKKIEIISFQLLFCQIYFYLEFHWNM